MGLEEDPKAQAARLALARERAGYATGTDGARALRVVKDTYLQHENGTRSLKRAARLYAEKYGVPAEWLIWGSNPPSWATSGTDVAIGAIRSMPIIDAVTAGRLADPMSQIQSAEFQTMEINLLPPGDYFSTRVDGDSMDRVSPPGSIIVVNRAERDPLPGRRYVFARRGKTTYKRFETDPLRLVPESTNPANEPIYPKNEEEWTVIGRVRLTLLDDL